MIRSGEAMVADSSKEGLGSPCCSLSRVDEARRGSARFGVAGSGAATVADGSTEGLGSPCCSLWRVDLARPGTVLYGKTGSGLTKSGMATVADGSTELRKKFPAALFGG
jgi:hypothetical protein